MTELKTLKDIKLFDDDLKDETAKGKIKAEAVKWVKEMMKYNELNINEVWFMKFFNLTKEDLKEVK